MSIGCIINAEISTFSLDRVRYRTYGRNDVVPAPNVIITWVFTVAGMVCALILAWHLAGSIQLLVAYAIIFVVASWGIVYLLLRFIILRIYMWLEDKYYARKKPSN